MDSAAGVHLTYHLKNCIHLDLDNQQKVIEIANGDTLKTQRASTIALEVMVSNTSIYVHINNLHYCLETVLNLFSLSVFGTIGCEFYTKKEVLHVIDTVGDTVL